MLFIVEIVKLLPVIFPVADILPVDVMFFVVRFWRVVLPSTFKSLWTLTLKRVDVPITSKSLLTVVVPRLGNPKITLFPLILIPSGRVEVIAV